MPRQAGADTKLIAVPATRVPVAYDADVVVVGAGPGGFAAALQAARMGVRVIVVEKFDMPGGVHTSGLQGSANAGVGGIHTELMQRFAAAGYIYTATQQTHPGWAGNPLSHYERHHKPDAAFARASFNPEGAGSIMASMLVGGRRRRLVRRRGFVDCIVERGSGSDRCRHEAIVVENSLGAGWRLPERYSLTVRARPNWWHAPAHPL